MLLGLLWWWFVRWLVWLLLGSKGRIVSLTAVTVMLVVAFFYFLLKLEFGNKEPFQAMLNHMAATVETSLN